MAPATAMAGQASSVGEPSVAGSTSAYAQTRLHRMPMAGARTRQWREAIRTAITKIPPPISATRRSRTVRSDWTTTQSSRSSIRPMNRSERWPQRNSRIETRMPRERRARDARAYRAAAGSPARRMRSWVRRGKRRGRCASSWAPVVASGPGGLRTVWPAERSWDCRRGDRHGCLGTDTATLRAGRQEEGAALIYLLSTSSARGGLHLRTGAHAQASGRLGDAHDAPGWQRDGESVACT